MRHHDSIRKFGRVKKQRVALMRSLARSFILKERMQTTEAKAKELRPFVEKLVTMSKKDTLAKRRIILARLGSQSATKKLFTEIGPRYSERPGGYTRITKFGVKNGRSTAQIEFV